MNYLMKSWGRGIVGNKSFLLDTHAFIWGITEPSRLGEKALSIMETRANDLWVSAASAWEIATKVRIAKLPGAEFIVHNFEIYASELGARTLSIEASHVLFGGSMAWDHRDPFDRVLAAQALIEGHHLVSMDAVFSEVEGLKLRWN